MMSRPQATDYGLRIHNERGVIAIFLATILAILLLTTTTYAARVSISELNQSSQIDQSEAAYYAAEAGVEDAIRRIDQSVPGSSIQQIFPQQFDATNSQPGDSYSLSGDGTSAQIITDTGSNGSLSWRHRRVYQQSSSFFGTLVKDQTEQFDMTELCRRMPTGVYGTAGCTPSGVQPVGKDFDGSDIFNKLTGLQFCWNDNSPGAQLEITDVSYPSGNASAVTTQKYITAGGSMFNGPLSVTTGATSTLPVQAQPQPGFSYCFTYAISSASRHIIRVKVLVDGVAAANADQYSVSYRAQLIENPAQASPVNSLYLPNQSYIIDVVGESGDIHRRVVARKLANGQLLGVFDYVLYSGDPLKDLCKIGVPQSDTGAGDVSYDPFLCTSTSVNND
jgi:hypothetical protein